MTRGRDAPEPVEVVFTKWGGAEHWHVPALRLGDDEHGTWLWTPPGTRTWRPGARFTHRRGSVVCVPRADDGADGADDGDAGPRWWVATFYDAHTPGRVEVYVDVATPPTWSRGDDDGSGGGRALVHAVDLDLDVVRPLGGEAFVDDEDEFVQHALELAYPADVVAAARRSADGLLVAVREHRAPFDGATARRWLDAGAALAT